MSLSKEAEMRSRVGARFRIATVQGFIFLVTCVWSAFYHSTDTFAAHPLITDDTGTQGKGRFQLEVNGEYGHDKKDGVTTQTTQLTSTLTYGVIDPLDIVLSLPYQNNRIEDSGGVTKGDGISDLSLEMKWRFYEKEGLSFALKPALTFPTGDNDERLGAGRVTYHLFFITSKEIKPWAFHLNLGYTRNDNKNDETKNLWHASLAATLDVLKDLKVVGNVGIETNTDRNATVYPAFILGGLVYSLTENFDIDFGVKGGITKPETDYSILAGITWRF
jgi:hypothetical protein